MKAPRPSWPDLRTLSALGFGPDAALMNEPKLFVDRRFLAALLLQLDEELGPDQGGATLFQIGLFHGLRDADRVLRGEFTPPGPGLDVFAAATCAVATPLAMRLGGRLGAEPSCAIELPGAWPECFESDARLARLGPADQPSCFLSAGYTSGWLSGTLDADVLVLEHTCLSSGASSCEFHAREIELWHRTGDPRTRDWLRSVNFDLFREVATGRPGLARFPDLPSEADSAAAFDPDAPVVHVWGPVMVMPYTGPDDALRTLDMLARDTGITSVRAVVLDLRDAILDEGFAAVALEQVIDSIESWGAEAILSRVSPLSESVVRGIERARLILRKDLPDAIASAFQIAEAQRSAA